jgi:predicted enzyme related to lactoylglutathione lyase
VPAGIPNPRGKRPPGSVCWIDLGVTDTDTAAAFYGELFGWDVAPPLPDGYRLASREEHLIAALGQAEEPGIPYWTAYVSTLDAAATAAAVQIGGGTVVIPPAPVSDVGIAATVRDPTGATFALWQPLELDGSWWSEDPGMLAGFELRVHDLAAARNFWSAAIGWELEDNGEIKCETNRVGAWNGSKTNEALDSFPSPWLINFHTDDLGAALRFATDLGATVLDDEHGLVRDPAGAVFRLAAPTR